MKTTLSTAMTFIASAAAGCGAAIAIASAAAVTHVAPELRPMTVPTPVVRLEPVVVTVSKSHYEAVRKQYAGETEVVRSTEAKKVARG